METASFSIIVLIMYIFAFLFSFGIPAAVIIVIAVKHKKEEEQKRFLFMQMMADIDKRNAEKAKERTLPVSSYYSLRKSSWNRNVPAGKCLFRYSGSAQKSFRPGGL